MEERLLRKHCCPECFPVRALETFIVETFFVPEKQKMFLKIFRNILIFQKHFVSATNVACARRMGKHCCGSILRNVSPFAGAFSKG